jgi:LemA protein
LVEGLAEDWGAVSEGVSVAAASAAGSAASAEAAAAVAAEEDRGELALEDKELAMKVMLRKTVVAGLLVLVAGGVSGCSYNKFVSQEEEIKTQWAEIQNQLQRRNDLIPNLVETVKGFAQQERDVFGQIADSRAKLAGAKTPEQTIEAANQQSAALSRLLVIVENYPQLRSNESFNRLMDELSGTENRIAVARMRYNEKVNTYNTSRRKFPSNITAGIFGFKDTYPRFDAPPEAERAPKVNFGRGGA